MSNRTVQLMKDNIDKLVYSSVQVEGIDATFAQTKEIIADGIAKGVSADDVNRILCIKRGLSYLFEHYESSLTWELYSTYDLIIGEGSIDKAGVFADLERYLSAIISLRMSH